MSYGILLAGLLVALTPVYLFVGMTINDACHTWYANNHQAQAENNRA